MIQSSLNIAKFFFAALLENGDVKRLVNNRVFYDHRNSTAEKENKFPYVVVCAGKAVSTGRGNKDSYFKQLRAGEVGVICVAKTANELAELQSTVYEAIAVAADSDIYARHPDWDFPRLYITPEADDELPSEDKGAMYRWLYFDCEF